jgi:hypothetical protein
VNPPAEMTIRLPDDVLALKIQNLPAVAPLPWDVVAGHDAQALANHGKTLEAIAAAGGLEPAQAVAIIEGRPYREMPVVNALRRLAEHVRAARDQA